MITVAPQKSGTNERWMKGCIPSLKLIAKAPENGWLEDCFPFGMAYFQGQTASFRECNDFSHSQCQLCRIASLVDLSYISVCVYNCVYIYIFNIYIYIYTRTLYAWCIDQHLPPEVPKSRQLKHTTVIICDINTLELSSI